jgi:hypothetical protein
VLAPGRGTFMLTLLIIFISEISRYSSYRPGKKKTLYRHSKRFFPNLSRLRVDAYKRHATFPEQWHCVCRRAESSAFAIAHHLRFPQKSTTESCRSQAVTESKLKVTSRFTPVSRRKMRFSLDLNNNNSHLR